MGWGWFDATQAQGFGVSLAQTFIDKLPPTHGLSSKQFEGKARETLTKLAKQVEAFRQANRLNFYQKAKLGNAFKWALRDAGYDAKYADELTEWLMLQLQ